VRPTQCGVTFEWVMRFKCDDIRKGNLYGYISQNLSETYLLG